MAQDSVVKEVLTDLMIEAGADLTRRLDEVGWPVFASFWLYRPESNDWKLVIASPLVASRGPRRAYEAIQAALGKTAPKPRLALRDIKAVEPSNDLIRALRTAVDTGATISGVRFTNSAIDGQFIHDAYIYRVSDRAPGGQAA